MQHDEINLELCKPKWLLFVAFGGARTYYELLTHDPTWTYQSASPQGRLRSGRLAMQLGAERAEDNFEVDQRNHDLILIFLRC